MSKLKEHAAKKRWESQHKKGQGDPMDIGAVNGSDWDSYGYPYEPCEYDYSGESGDINVIKGGKSKGYGKGTGKSYGPIVCGNCWQTGHMKADCPNPPTCNICHQSGHMAFECPHSSKGVKGNNIKGTGKGMGKSFQNQYSSTKGWQPKGWSKGLRANADSRAMAWMRYQSKTHTRGRLPIPKTHAIQLAWARNLDKSPCHQESMHPRGEKSTELKWNHVPNRGTESQFGN